MVDPDDKHCCCCETDVSSLPENICSIFGDPIVDSSDDKKVLVTIGLFSIIWLQREVQLLIPVVDFCIPQCECVASTDKHPCDLFDKLDFPVEEFFPPEKCEFDSIEPKKGCCDD